MESSETRTKIFLVLEAAFAGFYLATTRGLFVIYLISIGQSVALVSALTLASSGIGLVVALLVLKTPSLLTKKIKPSFLAFHTLERFAWVTIPMTTDPRSILAFFVLTTVSSVFVGLFLNLMIYGALSEEGVRDVTGKRTVFFNVASVLGSVFAVVMLALLKELRYVYTMETGVAVGLLSTLMVAFIDTSKLEGVKVPRGTESPERIFSTSLFYASFLAAGNILAIVWFSYVMKVLNGPDYLAASMNFSAMLASILAGFFWSRRSLKDLRKALLLNTMAPVAILLTPNATMHLGLMAYNAFFYTGASFLGSFLFANYTRWFGVVRSAILLTGLSHLGIVLASILGVVFRDNYLLLFLFVVVLMVVASITASVTIPEVATVREDLSRRYAFIVYRNSLIGYRTTVETSRESLSMTLRFLILALLLLLLYILYQTPFALLSR